MVNVQNRSTIPDGDLNELRRHLATYRNLYEIVTASTTTSLGISFTRSIEHADGSQDHLATRHAEAIVLCFSTDPNGMIEGISIWDTQPSSDELLLARRETREAGEDRRADSGTLRRPDFATT